MYIIKILLLLVCFSPFLVYGQIQQPKLPSIPKATQTLYIAQNGTDTNPGTALLPKRTFNNAVSTFEFLDDDGNGNTYCEIILLEGDYYLTNSNRMTQSVTKWRTPKQGGGFLKKNISLFGDGLVTIYGDSLPSNSILVLLAGSGISVRNLTIKNGTNSALILDGSEISHHSDVYIDNVTTTNVTGFGILIRGYDNIHIQNCTVTQTCKENEFEKNNNCQWASGLRTTSCSNVLINNCTVSENWGEGINISYTNTVVVKDNIVKDNYSANVYLHSASNAIISHNRIKIENPQFWRYCYGAKGTAASIGIANELTCENACFFTNANFNGNCGDKRACCRYTDYNNPILQDVSYKQIDSIYVFNNIVQGSGVSIWDAFSGLLNLSYINNVNIENNTFIGIEGTDSVNKGVIEFVLNTPFIYCNNVLFRNNIISYDVNRAKSTSAKLYVPSGICKGDWKQKISFFSNRWTKTPIVSGVSFSNDSEEPTLPISVDFTNLTSISPSQNRQQLVQVGQTVPYITDDFFHKPRNGLSNIGAIEIDPISSVQESNKSEFEIRSNHSSKSLNIFLSDKLFGKSIELYNSMGQLLYTTVISQTTIEINALNNIPSGIYFIRIGNHSQPIIWY